MPLENHLRSSLHVYVCITRKNLGAQSGWIRQRLNALIQANSLWPQLGETTLQRRRSIIGCRVLHAVEEFRFLPTKAVSTLIISLCKHVGYNSTCHILQFNCLDEWLEIIELQDLTYGHVSTNSYSQLKLYCGDQFLSWEERGVHDFLLQRGSWPKLSVTSCLKAEPHYLQP